MLHEAPSMEGGMKADLAQAREFLQLIDPMAQTFTLQTFDDDRARKASKFAGIFELGTFTPELLHLHESGAGVYLTINQTDGQGRRSQNIIRIRAVWQEDDDGFEGEFPLDPSLVVETSEGHYHRYWFVADDWPADTKGRDDFASVMQRMVADYGCDKNAKDLCRVLRLPGFYHCKGEPRMVSIVGGNQQRYTRAKILEAFPPVPEQKSKHANGYAKSVWKPQSEEGERIRAALQAIPSDDYDTYLSIGMALKAELGDGGFDPWRAWAMRSAKFDESECRRKWASIEPTGGVTIATLFGHARDHGWQEETRTRPRTYSNGSGPRSEPRPEQDGEAKPRIYFVPFDRIKLDRSQRRYLIKNVIPRHGLVVVWGPPKCGKSFLVFDMAMHVALGLEYRGQRVQQGPVIYCYFEGQQAIDTRVEAYRVRRLSESAESIPFHLMPVTINLVAEHPDLIAQLQAYAAGAAPAAIVLDTLNRSLQGSESSDEDMSAYVRAADAIREAFGCAVIIVHHCGHGANRPRGHSSLIGALDTQISVRKESAGQIVATVELMKDGQEGAQIFSRLEVVELGEDADGEQITSCVVEPVEGAAQAARISRAEKLTNGERIALKALEYAITEVGEEPPSSNHIPQGNTGRVVTIEQWREYARRKGISGGEKRAQNQAFKRSMEGLIAKGRVGIWEPHAWLAS